MSCNNIVGCAFDGAANMSGQYSGVQARMKNDNESIIHVHCYAHALNLVMSSATESCKMAKDFLGLLNSTAVFISESHKRMSEWTKVNKEISEAEGHELLRHLQKINTTRWWSKDKALRSIFDDASVKLEKQKNFLHFSFASTILQIVMIFLETLRLRRRVFLTIGANLKMFCLLLYIKVYLVFPPRLHSICKLEA